MSETIPTTSAVVDQPVKARRPLRLTMVLLWVVPAAETTFSSSIRLP